MKNFFYMGRNPRTKSGVSWKIWKIERNGRAVTTWWGPAQLHKRRPVPTGVLQSNIVRFPSVAEAVDSERRLIQSKLRKGYERWPRGRMLPRT